jgi:hypothetical protein
MIKILGLCLLMTALGAPLSAAEKNLTGTKTVLVIGTARIPSSDASKARDLAVSNGLVSAVNQTLYELLPEDGLVKYFQEINQTLLKDTKPYILDYKVPAEATADNIYRVVLRATVSKDALKKQLQDAGFIRSHKSLPKILFLISEKANEDRPSRFWWESQNSAVYRVYSEKAMSAIMSNSDFDIVSHGNIPLANDLTMIRRKSLLSDPDALRIGRNSIAQVIIVGDAQVEIAPNVMGTDKKTFKATLSVRALRSDTGEQISQIRQEAVILDSDPIKGGKDVLTQAGTLAGKALSIELAAKWQTEMVTTEQLTLLVEGISDLSSFVQFRKALKGMPGVNGIFINEMQADEASIMVDYDGSADALAEALMLNTFGSFGINIYEMTPDQLKIKLVKD